MALFLTRQSTADVIASANAQAAARRAGSDQQRSPVRRRNLPRNNVTRVSTRSGNRINLVRPPENAAVGRR